VRLGRGGYMTNRGGDGSSWLVAAAAAARSVPSTRAHLRLRVGSRAGAGHMSWLAVPALGPGRPLGLHVDGGATGVGGRRRGIIGQATTTVALVGRAAWAVLALGRHGEAHALGRRLGRGGHNADGAGKVIGRTAIARRRFWERGADVAVGHLDLWLDGVGIYAGGVALRRGPECAVVGFGRRLASQLLGAALVPGVYLWVGFGGEGIAG
jgi:hypothetical protein